MTTTKKPSRVPKSAAPPPPEPTQVKVTYNEDVPKLPPAIEKQVPGGMVLSWLEYDTEFVVVVSTHNDTRKHTIVK